LEARLLVEELGLRHEELGFEGYGSEQGKRYKQESEEE
jgi:hypothetical protein